ncbi:MAG: tetratricopeptide repeat protein [Bryobacteraceae bacterium]|nr:tetratricopeptide repeat protein [Bryobacteraceae bacterium]MDW8378756.1 tetratricopeptide repeat protein [Bryobacterales bacterium]
MKKLVLSAGALLMSLPLAAQKQPQPKSQKEVEAIMAIQNAPDPDSRIAAVENLLTKFADTEFKGFALYMATVSAQQKNDFEKLILYGERTLEADPKNYATMLLMSSAIAMRTREHDLDREEKLSRAEKLAKDAGEALKTATKPNPQIPDEQWEAAKKDFQAQMHEALGITASARKKYDEAIQHFKTAVELNGDLSTMVRLGSTYNLAQKYDEAIATLDRVLASADAPPQVKQVAQAERERAVKAKGAKN